MDYYGTMKKSWLASEEKAIDKKMSGYGMSKNSDLW